MQIVLAFTSVIGYSVTGMGTITLDLLERAAERDPRAARELVGVVTPIIQARITRVLLCRGAARCRDVGQEVRDLAQQVFVALLENNGRLLRSWEPARGMSFENYVGLIAEQHAAATFRGRNCSIWRDVLVVPEDLDSGIDSSNTPERIVASKEVLGAILEVLRAQVSDLGLLLFQLLFVEGRAIDEVSTIMGMSQSAVYAWRSRLGRRVEIIAQELLSECPGVDAVPEGAT